MIPYLSLFVKSSKRGGESINLCEFHIKIYVTLIKWITCQTIKKLSIPCNEPILTTNPWKQIITSMIHTCNPQIQQRVVQFFPLFLKEFNLPLSSCNRSNHKSRVHKPISFDTKISNQTSHPNGSSAIIINSKWYPISNSEIAFPYLRSLISP